MAEMFRYLAGILEKEEHRKLKILVILDLISPIMELFNFSVIINIINTLIIEKELTKTSIAVILLTGIVMIVKGFFGLYKCKIQSQFLYDGTQRLSVKLYELFVKENLLSHNQRSPIQALTMAHGDALNCINVIITSIEVWVNILMMSGYYAVLIYVSGWIGVVSCIAFTCSVIGIFFYHRNLAKIYGEKIRSQAIKANAQVTITYGCFKELKIMGSANTLHRYQDVCTEYAQTQKEYQYSRNVIGMLTQNFAMMMAFSVLICILLGAEKNMGFIFSSVVMYITIVMRMISMANCIVNGLHNVGFSKKSFEVIKDGLDGLSNIKMEEEKSAEVRRKKISFQRGISVRNLSFGYNNQVKIFQNASLDIPVGSSVAIIGVSGSGKTTFLDLILGLLVPQTGSILYDDYDIVTHMDKEGECVADIGDIASYIPQVIYLNGETIRNNVAFFIDENEIDESKVIECLKYAQIWDDVVRMPGGIDTLIGENGVAISGGQRQRIALARALYREFKILIMDEATASLDMETEKAVIDSIRHVTKDKTILIATHHMNLATECDMVYKIENQRFVRLK